MLRQNVNLYTSFKTTSPVIPYLNWRQLLLSTAVYLVLLILIYFFDVIDLYYQKYNLTQLKSKTTQLTTLFESKKNAYPAFFFSDNVAQKVAEQQKSMQNEAALLQKIANGILFSDIMLAVGHIDVTDVWLTEIQIEDGGNLIKLSGNALSMPDLKAYFAQIEKNIFFKQDHLTLDNVTHSPKEGYPDLQTYTISIVKNPHEKLHP